MGLLRSVIVDLCKRAARGRNVRNIPETGPLYLARYFLYPDKLVGGDKEDEDATPVGAYLHFFARSDADHELHNHPWEWGLSFILTGGYTEERRMADGTIRVRTFGPGRVNFLRANTYHRVDLLDEDRGAWTLFIRGPRTQSWGFWCRHTGTFTAWREFVSRKSARAQVEA